MENKDAGVQTRLKQSILCMCVYMVCRLEWTRLLEYSWPEEVTLSLYREPAVTGKKELHENHWQSGVVEFPSNDHITLLIPAIQGPGTLPSSPFRSMLNC